MVGNSCRGTVNVNGSSKGWVWDAIFGSRMSLSSFILRNYTPLANTSLEKGVDDGAYQCICLLPRRSRHRRIHPCSCNTDKVDDHVGNGDRRRRRINNASSYLVQGRVERLGQLTGREIDAEVGTQGAQHLDC